MSRRRRSRDEWREHLEELRRSELSREAYCSEHGLNPRTLTWWERELRRGRRRSTKASKKKGPLFVEVTAAAAVAADARLELEVGTIKVRVPGTFDAGTLSRLLVVLEAAR